MTDPRLERLRQLDAEATPGPWVLWDRSEAGYIVVGDTGEEPAAGVYTEADAEWIATARRIIPATIELLYEVLEMRGDAECIDCIRKAANAVLDQVGGDDA